MILGTLEILAEAYTIAEKAGIGAENIHKLVQGKSLSRHLPLHPKYINLTRNYA
jgi:3-hydroxyisobutyrate dehydrogenase-like beta-hydroxyacid dehydrogenase